jgi:2-dehydro-3-deoxy-D-arabinonate dehydratase
MHIVRYADRGGATVGVGVQRAGGVVALGGIGSVADLLRLGLAEIRAIVDAADGPVLPAAEVLLLPPVDGRTEVWGAGVTYEVSKWARVEESRDRSVYERVYEAERPELFFKAAAWRVVTTGEPVGIRADSGGDVPEPELGVVANAHGEIVGYVVCNDMTSRAIEGQNPLYLSQAKVFAGSCAISAGIRPAWEVGGDDFGVTLTVVREGGAAWSGTTSTGRMRRRPQELVDYLFRGDAFPDGAVLATGTGLIPELDFNLGEGDRVDIEISEVGVLSNPVVVGKEPLAWLVGALADPLAREAAR